MHSIKLNVNNKIYDHVMFLLKSLNREDLEIIEDKEISKNQHTKEEIKNLFSKKN